MIEITEEQRDALNRLIKVIGFLPSSRMEFAAALVTERPPDGFREIRLKLADELRMLGQAHTAVMDSFGWGEIP